MVRMIRKQVCIRPEQDQLLKRKAEELGVSEAALIRLGIDGITSPATAASPRDKQAWEEELDSIRLRAWEQSKALIKKRMAMRVPQTGRDWTRDELYEERLERLSH